MSCLCPIVLSYVPAFKNQANYPSCETEGASFNAVNGTKSIWREILISFAKDLTFSMGIALIVAFVLTIPGGPATFFILAGVTTVLSSLLRLMRFYCARNSYETLHSVSHFGNSFVQGLFAGTTMIPLIQGGCHAVFSPLFYQGGLPSIGTHLFSGYTLSPVSSQLTSFGTSLGHVGSQILCSVFGSITTIISASLLLSLSKQAAKLDPDLSNFLWMTAIVMIASEFVSSISQAVATGNPLHLLTMPLVALAYPLVLLFDYLFNKMGSCCTDPAPRPAQGGPGRPAVAPPQPPAFVPFSGQGRHLGGDESPPPAPIPAPVPAPVPVPAVNIGEPAPALAAPPPVSAARAQRELCLAAAQRRLAALASNPS